MSPRRGRMPRPKATLATGVPVPEAVYVGGPKTGVGLTHPPEAIKPLPETDIGQPGDRAVAVLSPGEGIYGMLSWLSSRAETLEVGVNHDPADLAALADEFCLANAIHRPKSRTWHKRVVIPGAAERDAVRPPPPPPDPDRPQEDPEDRQARLSRVRAGLRSRAPVERTTPPQQFSSPETGKVDQAGRTVSDRVAALGAGMSASPPSSYGGSMDAVPFDTPH